MAVVLGTNAEIVIPTVGSPSLAMLLHALAHQDPPWRGPVTVVDDRPGADTPLPGLPRADLDVTVVRSGARGPAAARNAGLTTGRAPWVVFLDDDVVPPPGWVAALHGDLAATRPSTAGVQGRILVVVDPHRARTDGPGPVRGLEHGRVATADLACRRDALTRVGGFDERLAHAHREDADLALRLRRTGATIVPGSRTVLRPADPPRPWACITRERANRDDARMRWEHGRYWRRDARVGRSRVRRQVITTGALIATVTAAVTGHPRRAGVTGALWLALTTEQTWARVAPGPRSPRKIAVTAATSAVLPPVAVYHRIRGELAVRKATTP